jgi:hypothetical protein
MSIEFVAHQDNKKRRTRTNHIQVHELQKLYMETTLPTLKQRQEIGAKIGMNPRAVQVWFQNRRQNLKKKQARLPSPVSDIHSSPSSPRPEQSRMSIDFLLSDSATEYKAAESLLILSQYP